MEDSKNKIIKIDAGDQVKHSTWGEGTVLFKSGVGDRTKVIITFPDHGQKKLLLKYAKLKKVKVDEDEE